MTTIPSAWEGARIRSTDQSFCPFVFETYIKTTGSSLPILFLATDFSSQRESGLDPNFLTTEYLHGSPEHTHRPAPPWRQSSFPSQVLSEQIFFYTHIKKINKAQPSKQNSKGPSFATSQPHLCAFFILWQQNRHRQRVIWDVGSGVVDGMAWIASFPFP